jgi:hypothetical protein
VAAVRRPGEVHQDRTVPDLRRKQLGQRALRNGKPAARRHVVSSRESVRMYADRLMRARRRTTRPMAG